MKEDTIYYSKGDPYPLLTVEDVRKWFEQDDSNEMLAHALFIADDKWTRIDMDMEDYSQNSNIYRHLSELFELWTDFYYELLRIIRKRMLDMGYDADTPIYPVFVEKYNKIKLYHRARIELPEMTVEDFENGRGQIE